MAHYLLTGSYTGVAWAAQIKNPQNRLEVVKLLFEEAGGRAVSAGARKTHMYNSTLPWRRS